MPVVEIVQIDSAGVATSVVRKADGGEDTFACVVCVDVSLNGDVVLVDVRLGELHAGISFHPGFGLHVGGLGGDEGLEVVDLDAERIERHLIVAAADAGIVGVKFAGVGERGLLPKTWEVQDAEGSGDAGTDEGNDVAHGMLGWVDERSGGSKRSA